ncbi:MAG: hypothetical protein V8Q57_06535 [Blautia sp.]
MVKLLIIADDFTGALDTGVQVHKGWHKNKGACKYRTEFRSEFGCGSSGVKCRNKTFRKETGI